MERWLSPVESGRLEICCPLLGGPWVRIPPSPYGHHVVKRRGWVRKLGGIMGSSIEQLVDESIKVELNVAKLYRVFQNLFPEDAKFWGELASEEDSHANLIEIGKETLLSCDEFPIEILASSVDEVRQVNDKIEALLDKFSHKKPSRKESFEIAISLEESAGEMHFQQAVTSSSDASYIEIFQKLNGDDVGHAKRISDRMKEVGCAE